MRSFFVACARGRRNLKLRPGIVVFLGAPFTAHAGTLMAHASRLPWALDPDCMLDPGLSGACLVALEEAAQTGIADRTQADVGSLLE